MRGFLETRVRWLFVFIVSAASVMLVLLAYRYVLVPVGPDIYRIDALRGRFCKYPCHTPPPQPQASPGPSPTPSNWEAFVAEFPSSEHASMERSHRFDQLAALKPLSMANFGQQMDVTSFQLHLQFHQVLEASDGSLYVVAESCAWVGPGGCSRYHFGMLNADNFMEIWLPHQSGEWQQMEMAAASTPDEVVVRTMAWGGTQLHQYRVTRHDIVQTAITHDGVFTNPIDHRLRSGETCRVEADPASAIYVKAVSASGQTRPLVSKADFLAAAQHLITLSDPNLVYCTHFQEVDMLIAGYYYTRVTFVVAQGHLWLAAPAEPSAITPHHMVLFTSVIDAQGHPSGDTFDYVNVTRKKLIP